MPIAILALAALLAPLPAPAQPQLHSALQARGDAAAHILDLTWVLFVAGALIFAAVLACLVLALRGGDRVRALLAQRSFLVGAGIAFPVVALSVLLVYTFQAAAAMDRHAPQAAARIQVTGELWWWRVRYLDASGAVLLETANELHVPAGERVDLALDTREVIHSFWVPSLAGKVDMIPGHVNRLRLRALQPGVYRGMCAEFCGAQHALMAFEVVARPPQDYAGWLAAQRQPAAAPATPAQVRGQQVFLERRCGACHAVRGTPAAGTLGPDLTHVASRLSLGAATLPNGEAQLAEWIRHVQRIKPDTRMPAYPHLPREELDALVAYLAHLR